jgi:hypothetical protein
MDKSFWVGITNTLIASILVLLIEYLVIKPLADRQRRKSRRLKPAKKRSVREKSFFVKLRAWFAQQTEVFFSRLSYWFLFSFFISIFIGLDIFYPIIVSWLSDHGLSELTKIYPAFVSKEDRSFVTEFIAWFGALYGFLVPLVLVKVWEQFDTIDREFDREADALLMFFEDVQLLGNKYRKIKKQMLQKLRLYIQHVSNVYDREHHDNSLRKKGDTLLRQIRSYFNPLVQISLQEQSEATPILPELFGQLNEIIDIRGDRMSLTSRRPLKSFKYLVLVASLVWVIPLYFTSDITNAIRVSLFSDILRIAITLLAILILSIIDDLDDPFKGTWTINIETWGELQEAVSLQLSAIDRDDKVYIKGNKSIL